jgi:hypothetical protein
MDKRIIDALTDAGLITTHVDHTEYDTVEELMNDGMITFVNEKEAVMEIARMFDDAIVVNNPVETDVVEDDKDPEEEIIIITDEPTEQVIEEIAAEVETKTVVEPEETPVETVEVAEESKPKKKKTTKKAE